MRVHEYRIAGEPVEVRVCTSEDDLELFDVWARDMANSREPVAVDTETTGLDVFSVGHRLRLVQFGDDHTAWVIPVEAGRPFWQAAIKWLTRLPRMVVHNAAYDLLVLDRHMGLPLEETFPRVTDSKIIAALIDPRQPQDGGVGTGLKPLSAYWIDPNAPDTQEGLTAVFRSLKLTKATGWAGVPLDNPTYELYAGLDVLLTSRLLKVLRRVFVELGIRPALVPYEHQLALVCAIMQRAGMVLDEDYVRQLDAELEREAEHFARIASRFGVENINSTRQVADCLLAMGEALTERTAGGAIKADKAVLLALADMDLQWNRLDIRRPNPLANAVVRSKRAGKWRSAYVQTFIETMDANGRVHPNVNPLQARTGRMSINRPALQTLPSSDAMIRRALLADEGHVTVSCDFAAVEMRVLAALADVRRMKEALHAGRDLHDFTAELVFGPDFTKAHRKLAKGIGFGKVYGGGAATIQRQTGAPMEQVRVALSAYDRVYPEIKRASARWQREAMSNGMVIETVTGRRQPLDRDRTYAVVNYMVQSAARDVLGQAILTMHEQGLTQYLRLPIHDEVVASVPAGEAKELAKAIEDCMTMDLFGVHIAAEAEIGGRPWGSLYPNCPAY
ncbi:DNA polymerase [Kitasatospora purpeofusca]|uniref:DNA polymerase n=1 Tax=Kitasatospora purpeofusca TaxID=67352 RepID=UPI0022546647|nr:DNA polymerase [Kitasatospora purpeofusca]MCX4687315.1 DNA polymerase [Kitasatospora purpeofusca]